MNVHYIQTFTNYTIVDLTKILSYIIFIIDLDLDLVYLNDVLLGRV